MSEAKQPIAVDRRARRDRAWWEQAVARLQASGMSAAAFAHQEGMGYETLRRWRARFRRSAGARAQRARQAPKFVALPLLQGGAAIGTQDAALTPIEVEIDGALRIRLSGQAAKGMIDALLGRIHSAGR